MTEPTTPADDTTDLTGGPNGAPDVSADEPDNPAVPRDVRQLRRENKTLRERAKAAEAELETRSTQLAAMRRAEVERLAGSDLIDPSDLWSAHPDVDGFLTEDGTIDPTKVAEAAQAITTAKPHLAADKPVSRPPSDRPIESLRPGASSDTRPAQPTWADALRR
jgi:hypothetical protein